MGGAAGAAQEGGLLPGLDVVVDRGIAITAVLLRYLLPDFVVSEITHKVVAPHMVVLPIPPRDCDLDYRQSVEVAIHIFGVTAIVDKEAIYPARLIVQVLRADNSTVLLAVGDSAVLILENEMLAPILIDSTVRQVVSGFDDSDNRPLAGLVDMVDAVAASVHEHPNGFANNLDKSSHIKGDLISRDAKRRSRVRRVRPRNSCLRSCR